MNESPQLTLNLVLRYLLAYLAWIVVGIVGFWLLFQIRTNLLDVLTFALEDPDTMRDTWMARGIDRWFIVLMGAIWVFCIALLEGYFRNGVAKQILMQRLRRVSIIMGSVAAVSFGLRMLFQFVIS